MCYRYNTGKSTKYRKAEHLIQPGTKAVGTVEDYPKAVTIVVSKAINCVVSYRWKVLIAK